MRELEAGAVGFEFGLEASGCCCNCNGGETAGPDVGGASGVAPWLSGDASSPKKDLKTPLCCQAWMKNSCWAGSLTALTSLLPSGCFR